MSIGKKIQNGIYVFKVSRASGEKFSDTRQKMADYRANSGVGFQRYFEDEIWSMSEEEREMQLQKRPLYVYAKQISEVTDWDVSTATKKLKEAKKNLGVPYRKYLINSFFELTEEEQKKRLQALQQRAERRLRREQKHVQTVAEATGWTYEEALAKMEEARDRCGAFFKNYVEYRFWELDDETQDSYFNNSHVRQLSKKFITTPEKSVIFKNKKLFNIFFADYIGRAWIFNKDLNRESFEKTFGGCRKIIYKPLDAARGKGIKVYELQDETLDDAIEEICQLPKGVVEEFVKQHRETAKFSNDVSVNTIRILSVLENSKCYVPYAVMRIGGGKNPLDHIHNGGLLGPVDPATGKIFSAAVDYEGELHEVHPLTGETIKGFEIPYWEDVKKLIGKATRLYPTVGFVGWDVAILEDGPILIEGNTYPAADNVQLPFTAFKRGTKFLFDKFLDK